MFLYLSVHRANATVLMGRHAANQFKIQASRFSVWITSSVPSAIRRALNSSKTALRPHSPNARACSGASSSVSRACARLSGSSGLQSTPPPGRLDQFRKGPAPGLHDRHARCQRLDDVQPKGHPATGRHRKSRQRPQKSEFLLAAQVRTKFRLAFEPGASQTAPQSLDQRRIPRAATASDLELESSQSPEFPPQNIASSIRSSPFSGHLLANKPSTGLPFFASAAALGRAALPPEGGVPAGFPSLRSAAALGG